MCSPQGLRERYIKTKACVVKLAYSRVPHGLLVESKRQYVTLACEGLDKVVDVILKDKTTMIV